MHNLKLIGSSKVKLAPHSHLQCFVEQMNLRISLKSTQYWPHNNVPQGTLMLLSSSPSFTHALYINDAQWRIYYCLFQGEENRGTQVKNFATFEIQEIFGLPKHYITQQLYRKLRWKVQTRCLSLPTLHVKCWLPTVMSIFQWKFCQNFWLPGI